MPYITLERRSALVQRTPDNAGELNYKITRMVDRYLAKHGARYEQINAAIGALECAKLELYRRIAAPHEDKKCEANGDVYFNKGV